MLTLAASAHDSARPAARASRTPPSSRRPGSASSRMRRRPKRLQWPRTDTATGRPRAIQQWTLPPSTCPAPSGVALAPPDLRSLARRRPRSACLVAWHADGLPINAPLRARFVEFQPIPGEEVSRPSRNVGPPIRSLRGLWVFRRRCGAVVTPPTGRGVGGLLPTRRSRGSALAGALMLDLDVRGRLRPN